MTGLRIFVRRGAIRRFNLLKRDAAGLPVSIEWDRRQTDRRAESPTIPAAPCLPAPAEQRRAERRSEPPFTWSSAEFVVVDDGSADAESTPE